MIVKEYRIVMPLTTEEYQRGVLWTACECSRQETGGGDGIEVLANRPFEGKDMFDGATRDGQFTHKIYHLYGKLPGVLQAFFTKENCQLHEKSHNAFPYCHTVTTNPGYLKERLRFEVLSVHFDNDLGNQDNPLKLPADLLKKREIVRIDIADDKYVMEKAENYDVTKFKSEKTGRGPLVNNGTWASSLESLGQPYMCVYKAVVFECRKFGMQSLVERQTAKQMPLVTKLVHRQIFCEIDNWIDLSYADVRRFEDESVEVLNRQRNDPQARGVQFK